MDQHVISAFLLRRFARMVGQRRMLTVFDKATGRVEPMDVRNFLTEPNAHSAEIETEIGRIEGPASRALWDLSKAMRRVSPGIYAVGEAGSARVVHGPAVEDMGVRAGMHIHVTQHQVPGLADPERAALLRFVAL